MYDLKEMENIKNAKIVSVAWHHNVLTEMFTITEKSALLYEKVKFLTSPNPSRHHRQLLIFRINSAWYNLKAVIVFFLKKMYSSLDTEKVKQYKMVTAYVHLFRSRVQFYASILGIY